MLLKQPLIYLTLLGCLFPSMTIASALKADEHVIFLPDIAYEVNNGEVEVNVQAWIYEKERRLGMTTALTKYLGIDKSKLTPEQLAQLYARTQLFRVDSERNKNIKIQFADKSIHSLPRTNNDGRSSAVIRLKTKQAVADDNTIHYTLYQSGIPASINEGTVFFAPSTGLSIISDIDDTIKDSNVLNKQQLLINTFLNDFVAATGMSDWYNKISKSSSNVSFHYVSSSPIQLYPILQEFIDKEQFPKGSMHLRESTRWNRVIASEGESKAHKIAAIQKLLDAYPQRNFILVGDSGEEDPEIYANFMRQNPKQISCIAIRDVTSEDEQATRYHETFKNLDTKQWKVFKDPTTLNNWCIDNQ